MEKQNFLNRKRIIHYKEGRVQNIQVSNASNTHNCKENIQVDESTQRCLSKMVAQEAEIQEEYRRAKKLLSTLICDF